MKAAEKLAARERLARSRAVKGWVFRGLPAAEEAAIRAFLDGGDCPEGYSRLYDLAREQLKLPARDAWVICPCASSGPVTATAAREAIARVLEGGPGICRLPRMIAGRNLTPGERAAAFAATGYTCPDGAGPPACCTTPTEEP